MDEKMKKHIKNFEKFMLAEAKERDRQRRAAIEKAECEEQAKREKIAKETHEKQNKANTSRSNCL